MFPECQFVCEDVHVLRYRPRRSGVEVCHVPTCIHRYCTFGTWTEREEAGSQAGARPGRETHAARRRMRMPPSIRGVTLSPKRRRFVLSFPSSFCFSLLSSQAGAAAIQIRTPVRHPAAAIRDRQGFKLQCNGIPRLSLFSRPFLSMPPLHLLFFSAPCEQEFDLGRRRLFLPHASSRRLNAGGHGPRSNDC